jgi:hypothetical protein
MKHWVLISAIGTALSKQESTVINIGEPEGTPRLVSKQSPPPSLLCWQLADSCSLQITYLSSSQGFAWNPELFLPSYIDCEYTPLENRRDPVHEITLSDEETKQLLPQ